MNIFGNSSNQCSLLSLFIHVDMFVLVLHVTQSIVVNYFIDGIMVSISESDGNFNNETLILRDKTSSVVIPVRFPESNLAQ